MWQGNCRTNHAQSQRTQKRCGWGEQAARQKQQFTSMRSNEMQDFRTRHGSHLDASQLLQALYLHALDLVQLGANCVVDQFQMHGNGSALQSHIMINYQLCNHTSTTNSAITHQLPTLQSHIIINYQLCNHTSSSTTNSAITHQLPTLQSHIIINYQFCNHTSTTNSAITRHDQLPTLLSHIMINYQLCNHMSTTNSAITHQLPTLQSHINYQLCNHTS